MNVNVEDLSATRKKLVVEIPVELVNEEEKEILGHFAQRAKLPGFRPGKAPVEMIRKRFAKDIQDELERKVRASAYEKGIEESKLDVLQVIDFDGEVVKSGQPSQLEVTVDIRPQFELPEYKGVEVQVPPLEVSAGEIDSIVERIRKDRAERPVKDGPAEEGDHVKVSYEGFLGEQPIAEVAPDRAILGKQENTWEEAGDEKTGVEAVVHGVVGLKAGESGEREMTFPQEFPVEALAGQKALYKFTVHEVRDEILPELNEDFFKTLGVESGEQFRERIEQDLKQRKEHERRDRMVAQISDKLAAAVEVEVPQSAVESETQQVMREIVSQNKQRNVADEELEKHKEEIYNSAVSAAQGRIKMQFILARVAEAENIEVENEDMQQAILSRAMQRQMRPDQYVKELQKDRNQLMSIRQSVLFNKTLDFLMEQAKVSEVAPQEGHAHAH